MLEWWVRKSILQQVDVVIMGWIVRGIYLSYEWYETQMVRLIQDSFVELAHLSCSHIKPVKLQCPGWLVLVLVSGTSWDVRLVEDDAWKHWVCLFDVFLLVVYSLKLFFSYRIFSLRNKAPTLTPETQWWVCHTKCIHS